MVMKKIVLTGGPCAGKTTGMKWIQDAFTAKGYRVLFIPETATELIPNGISPVTLGSMEEYEKLQMGLQLKKEETYQAAAGMMGCEKVLIVCDRGIMDVKAYIPEEFDRVIEAFGMTKSSIYEKYDGVFHLVSAAKGAEQFYTTENNSARSETAEEAATLDDKVIDAWKGHPHLRVIENAADFETKMKNLVDEISRFLGE